MRHVLIPHPATPQPAVSTLTCEITRSEPDILELSFVLKGNLDVLALPPAGALERTDELWRHTCFEAFLRVADRPEYVELNIAPSGQWAAYRFTDYREAMEPELDCPPALSFWLHEGDLGIEASFALPQALAGPSWRLALSAVLEAKDGTKSYWALAHPPGAPDFHHPDCFTAQLPPPTRA